MRFRLPIRYTSRMRFALLSLLIPTLVSAGAEPPAPRAQFEETAFQAGTVLVGQSVRHTFAIRNTGNADLTLLDVKPG